MLDTLFLPPLEPGVVQLWHARVADVQADLSPLLTAEERRRAERFVFEANRQEFVVGRALVRLVLARHLDVLPGELRFRSGCYGKPALAWGSLPLPIHFNVSHSGGLVVAAFSLDGELGVDVEDAQREISPAVMQNVFTPREREQLASLPPQDRRAASAARWTLKEAYLKARGDGLNLPLLGFAFDCAGHCSPKVTFSDSIDDDPAQWQIHQTRLARHVVALALRDSRSQVEHHDFTLLLNSQLLNLQIHHDRSRQSLVAVG